LKAKLDSVLKEGLWCWRPAHSEELVIIQSRLPEIPIGAIDELVWTISKTGTYSSAETYNHLRKKKNSVIWWPLVWHKYAIPKQAFILWLAMHNRLTTGDRMLTWAGVLREILYVFSAVEELKARTIYSSHMAFALES
jgi:hypothetical protein